MNLFDVQYVTEIRARETDKDKQIMYDKQISTVQSSFEALANVTDVEEKRKVKYFSMSNFFLIKSFRN